jgi:hypothetical protein
MSEKSRSAKPAQPAESAGKTSQASGKQSPTVTSSGQVIWSTRDLLFPAGHAPKTLKK